MLVDCAISVLVAELLELNAARLPVSWVLCALTEHVRHVLLQVQFTVPVLKLKVVVYHEKDDKLLKIIYVCLQR